MEHRSDRRAGFQPIWRFVSTRLFGGGSETWLRLQMAYNLAQARRHEGQIKVKPVARRKLHESRARKREKEIHLRRIQRTPHTHP